MGSHSKTVLIIDDDQVFAKIAARYLKAHEVEVLTAHTGADGLKACAGRRVDVVLLDQNLPDVMGYELCEEIVGLNEHTKIIFITAYPSIENAIVAIQAGAFDYLAKPFGREQMGIAIRRALRTLELETVEELHNRRTARDSGSIVIAGADKGLSGVVELADMAASNNAAVLITGETGTGKNVLARYIHFNSGRSGPFISINCASLPESLIEAELFGHEKGAYTGATSAKRGIFELAEGGTLLLDEIGEMPVALQAKLLGVLDEMSIRRLGSESVRPIDVRIIASTNIDLDEAIAQNRFRRDLYYRLSVININMPPLRERLDDLPELCAHLAGKSGLNRDFVMPECEIDALRNYAWPGNVRELQNVVERSLMIAAHSTDKTARPSTLISGLVCHARAHYDTTPAAAEPRKDSPVGLRPIEEVERDYIIKALAMMSHNRSKTAEALGISRSTLMRKLSMYGIE